MRVEGPELMVWGLGFRVESSEFEVWGILVFRVEVSGLRVEGLEFRVWGSGSRV